MTLLAAILHQHKQYVYLNIRMPIGSVFLAHSSGSYSKKVLSEVAILLINSEIPSKNVYYKS